MSAITIRYNGQVKPLYTPDKATRVFKTGEVKLRQPQFEETRQSVINAIMNIALPVSIATNISMNGRYTVLAASEDSADNIRRGFQELLDVFTALAEPVLWFYALTACILMVTKNKDDGIEKLKFVAYAYIGITLLPTFFSLLRWVSDLITGSISI